MGTYVQTIERRGKIDDPVHWADDEVVRQPAFNLKEFQKRINKIVGTTRDKKDIIRARWTWDPDCYQEYFIRWDAAGSPLESEFRAKYKYQTIEVDSQHSVDICPPRFVLEERLEPAQYFASWEANRWEIDSVTKKQVCVRPSAPRDGYYTFLAYVAMHDPNNQCCKAAAEADAECFGVFRKPSEVDLLALSRLKKVIDSRKKRQNPYEPISSETLSQILFETDATERERQNNKHKEKEESRRFYEDLMKPHAEFSLPTLPNEQRTEAGLIVQA